MIFSRTRKWTIMRSDLTIPLLVTEIRGCRPFSRLEMSAGSINHKSIAATTAPPIHNNYYTLDRGSSPLLAQITSQTHANHSSLLTTSIYTCCNYFWLFFFGHTIKVPPNQTYCAGDTAYLNEPTYRRTIFSFLFSRLTVHAMWL